MTVSSLNLALAGPEILLLVMTLVVMIVDLLSAPEKRESRLYCLSIKDGLKTVWESDHQSYTKYTALVASDTRVLAMTLEAEFVLFDAKADEYTELGRVKVLPDEKGLYSHPAFVGKRVYVRGGNSLSCLELGE